MNIFSHTPNHWHKKHLPLAISVAFLGFINTSPAHACAVSTGNGIQLINERGCSYTDNNLTNSGNTSAVIDLKDGSSASFTAPDITLHKTSGGTSSGTYAAIFLRPEADASKNNQAIFEGNVTVNEASNSRFPRDIIVSGGGDLLIKGNLTVHHGRGNGGIINVNAADGGWYVANRTDTKMRVEGDTELNINGSTGTTAVRVGDGTLTFAGKVLFNSNQSAGQNFLVQNEHSVLTFEKTVTANVNQSFLQVAPNANHSQITFNDKLTVNQADHVAFRLGSGTTNLNADTTINAANTGAFQFEDSATLNNNGTITATTQDGIALHTTNQPVISTAIFNNKDNGIINQAAGVGRHNNDSHFFINNSGTLSSDRGDVFANTASGDINLTNNAQGKLSGSLNKASGVFKLTNAAGATWTASDQRDSVLSQVINSGTIAFAPVDLTSTAPRTITTDQYTGGGTLIMNTKWDDDAALGDNGKTVSDKLRIDQINGTDVTTVKIHAANIGSITPKASNIHSDDVIEVHTPHTGNLFVGTVNTTGTQQAQLAKNGNNYHWTLKANNGSALVNPDAVSYLQTSHLSLGIGLEQLSRLHQRIGTYHNQIAHSGSHNQILWSRLIGNHSKIQGQERFGADSKTFGLQIGGDVHQGHTAAGGKHHSGLLVAYSHGKHRLYDKFRSVHGVVSANKYIGQAHSDVVSVGAYHTRYAENGAYLDLVGQLSWLQNRHSQAKQRGFATGFSAEIGKPYALGSSNWKIEPQAQLVYQFQHLNGKTDDVGRHIHSDNTHRLMARLGGRILWQTDKGNAYLTANLIRPFGKTHTTVDGAKLTENFNVLKAELGLGAQFNVTSTLNLYADARYTRSLNKNNQVWRSNGARESGYNTNIGLRFVW